MQEKNMDNEISLQDGSGARMTSQQMTWITLSRYIMQTMSLLGKRFSSGRPCMPQNVPTLS